MPCRFKRGAKKMCWVNGSQEGDERLNREQGQRLEENEENGKVIGVNGVDDVGGPETKRAKVDKSSTTIQSDNIGEEADLVHCCPVCLEKYSSTRYPIVSPNKCSHSICADCGNRSRSSVCPICNSCNYGYEEGYGGFKKKITLCSTEWKKNYALCDLIEFHSKKEEQLKADQLNCATCTSKEKREKMNICVTCAEKWNKEWKGMKEEEIRPFIMCAHCLIEDTHRGHVFVKYWPWKVDLSVHSSVAVHQSVVSGMIELSGDEMETGKCNVEQWKKQLDSFRVSGAVKCSTHCDLSLLKSRLREESDVVTQAVDDCIFPLRNCSKIVKESFDRLLELKEKYVKNGREAQDEAVGGDV